MWAEVLDVDEVPDGAGFFEIGGHSLLAIRVMARLRDRLGVDLALVELFTNPTIETFAAVVAEQVPDETGGPEVPLMEAVPTSEADADTELDALLAELQTLSADEARALLAELGSDAEDAAMSIDVRRPGGLDAASALPDPTKAIAAPWFPPVTRQIAAIVERMPDAVAIEDQQGTMTYAELWRAGERLALRLQRAGVESDDRVAIAGVRSPEFVVAMIAVLRTGAIAVPIDASLPPIRRSAMLEESGVRFVLSIHGAPDDVATYAGSGITHIPAADPANGNGAVTRPSSPSGPAYIYFTSGSTGVPKGSLGTHQGLGQFVSWQHERFAVGPGTASPSSRASRSMLCSRGLHSADLGCNDLHSAGRVRARPGPAVGRRAADHAPPCHALSRGRVAGCRR